MVAINVNGVRREIQAPNDTPLLYVLRNDLELSGPQFGCGLAQCGACSVLLDGKEVRSCITPISQRAAARRSPRWKGFPPMGQAEGPVAADAEKTLHPVQQAWIEEQTPLCGFCQNGMMIKATELLESNRDADRRGNQRGVHNLWPVTASLPLRKLYGHHRRGAARRRHHGERELSDGDRKKNQSTFSAPL